MNELSIAYTKNQIPKKNKFPENLKALINNNKIKKRNTYNKGIYNININNFNINTKRELAHDYSSKTIEILTDLKKTLFQTEIIKERISNNKRIFNGFEEDNEKYKIMNNENIGKLKNIKVKPLRNDNKNNNNSFFIPKIEYKNKNFAKRRICKTPTINRNISYIYKSNNNLEQKRNLEINYIKSENKNMKKESNFLINENDYLSWKINLYKNRIKNNALKNPKYINYYEEKLMKFINSIKFSFHNFVSNNLDLSKLIIKKFKENKKLKNIINKIIENEKRKNMMKEMKENIKNNSEIYNNLKRKNKALNLELEKCKINLEELKSKGEILSSRFESKLKCTEDKIDLIRKLKFTISKLNKSEEITNKNKILQAKNLKLNINNNIRFYLSEINQLNLIYKSLLNQKNILIEENKKLILDNKNTNINFDKNKLKELKEQISELKNVNKDKKLLVNKKEKQIIILKDVINKISDALQQKNMKDEIFKLDIDKLIKDDYDDKEYQNFLIKNKLKKSVKKLNYYKNNENIQSINEIKIYENIIKKKDIEILNLENEINKKSGILKIIEEKVKPLYKKNYSLSKANSFIYSKSANRIISIDSQRSSQMENKPKNLFNKIRKQKNQSLYMNNINNSFDKNFN